MLNTILRSDVANVLTALALSRDAREWQEALEAVAVALGLREAVRNIQGSRFMEVVEHDNG